MKRILAILMIMSFQSKGIPQITHRVFIQDAHSMDGIGSIDVIAFDKDESYKEYHWVTSSQVLKLLNYGSYTVTKDTIFCLPLSKKADSFEFIISKVDKKYRLLRNEKVYTIDGTLSELRLHGWRYGEELTKEQYKNFKAIRAIN